MIKLNVNISPVDTESINSGRIGSLGITLTY